jgi:hypothetical protein
MAQAYSGCTVCESNRDQKTYHGVGHSGIKFIDIILEVSGRGGLETDLRKTLEPDLDNASEGKPEMDGRLRLKKPESSFLCNRN